MTTSKVGDVSLVRWAGCGCADNAETDVEAPSVAAAEATSVFDIS
jgi:hypothetical protein